MARLLFQVSKKFEYHYICIILVLTDPTEMIDIEIDNNERYNARASSLWSGPPADPPARPPPPGPPPPYLTRAPLPGPGWVAKAGKVLNIINKLK